MREANIISSFQSSNHIYDYIAVIGTVVNFYLIFNSSLALIPLILTVNMIILMPLVTRILKKERNRCHHNHDSSTKEKEYRIDYV